MTTSSIEKAPWLVPVRARLAEAWAGPRFPHALLVHGRPGVGAEHLAEWLSHLMLCERPGTDACGECTSCALVKAGNHPDYLKLTIEEDASFIKIEQVRELSEWASLKSYRGRRRVVVIDPADYLYYNAFNALLKTLEEPSESLALVLVATRLEKLPRTIMSRCQHVRVPTPDRDVALAWLRGIDETRDWEDMLDLAAGAPLGAVSLARAGMGEVADDLRAFLAAMQTGRGDPLKAAEAWTRDRPFERLLWLEHWAMAGARAAVVANGDAVDNNETSTLPSGTGPLKIRACFEFVDRVREARNLLQGSLNTQLLLEGIALAVAELVRVPLEPRGRPG
ncbi:MAG: DNA polymerase III subunit delta' [Gammaproteobacteria bacterium]|nr:DNA polymerase III subunit delta' [Gammaproteobacteria bacterium]